MRGTDSDTIFALSSGAPPAGIAVIRVSGPAAGVALKKLSGALPPPRRASYRRLTDPDNGEVLDTALLLWFPSPGTATGEDLGEFHLHGGRAVISGVLSVLGRLEGLRPAQPGEFTRRAFANGRIDLSEAEGLADLLEAETRSQRLAALRLAGGALSREVEEWTSRLLTMSAMIEAELDFSDEGDVDSDLATKVRQLAKTLADDLASALQRPSAERLKDGILVALAGPVNAGKSSLINALAGRDVAITSAIPGTTRDLVEAPVAFEGIPMRLVDTAGLRESEDAVEAIGVERAKSLLTRADIILWVGDDAAKPAGDRVITVASKIDLAEEGTKRADFRVSSVTGEGIGDLALAVAERAKGLLPGESETALNERHRAHIGATHKLLQDIEGQTDSIIVGELLRLARLELDAVTGRAGVENMLDMLFGRFCIGK